METHLVKNDQITFYVRHVYMMGKNVGKTEKNTLCER